MTHTHLRSRRSTALLLMCIISACGEPSPPAYIRLDGPAPSLADAPGDRMLVSFWATWCPPCREETKDLLALSRRALEGLRVVIVSQDEDWQTVEQFLGGPPDPALHLRLDAQKRLFDAFGVHALPTSILVVDGRLIARFQGPRDWDAPEVRSLLERLIGEAERRAEAPRSLTFAERAHSR